jgi:hypothetical protein
VGIALTAIVAFSILFTFFFIQGFFSSSPSVTSASSPVENGLQLSVILDSSKNIFKQGEDINLTFALINVSNQTKNLTNVNGISTFDFWVYNHNNNLTYAYVIGAYPIINESILLLPKANYTETLTWGQLGNASDIYDDSQVPAGTYYIIGFTNEPTNAPNDVIPYLQTRLTITIESQPPLIEITIVFLVAVVSCISIGLLLYRRHRKTANLKQ